MIVIEIIPYATFREKLQIVKKYLGQGKVEIYDSYVYIERIEMNYDN